MTTLRNEDGDTYSPAPVVRLGQDTIDLDERPKPRDESYAQVVGMMYVFITVILTCFAWLVYIWST